ncbi:hypothetical protein [Gimesia panareensis]|uniref:Uncharacterized protein n=1 Tax=Gimesia panareensis TaxID=2527978 RepID=A0A517QGN0_9PLAN|nr:hypothetical protein [Gimesia panareensis]QDT30707.1 hypothetical protein Enr10x_60750 [Gimesia panareensis]QDU53757.1 hypothetical protein Pan110_61510 [Gimesia panareensis]
MAHEESKESIAALRKEVALLADLCRPLFDSETLTGVDHYLNHNEPEMALEGLLIELIQANRYPVPFDTDRWEQIVASADFSDGGVFEEEILHQFRAWLAGSKPQ